MRFGILSLSIGLVMATSVASAQSTPRSWLAQREAHEQRLRSAEIEGFEDVGEGVTNPKKVTLKQGDTVFYAIHKPLKRGRQKGYWESYQAEVAAYILDKLLGLDMVPPTVVRRVDGELGSLQLWVDGCDTYKRLEPKVPQTPEFSQQISRMKMFDNLIHNDDRNAGNFLLDEAWNVILIDHSRAFLDQKKLLGKGTSQPAQYDRELVARLKLLSKEQLELEFDKLLGGRQVNGVMARRDKILEHLQSLIDERGELRVLFN